MAPQRRERNGPISDAGISLVEVEGLLKKFGNRTAVRGITLEVKAGGIVGLIGPDGAGKTTFLRLLMGLLPPTSGRVRIRGLDVLAARDRIRTFVGYMPQHFSLYSDLTVAENLRFFADLYGVARAEFALKKSRLLKFSGLASFQNRPAGKLSGGMQKKLALASNLLHTPELLLLDEPTTGVDPISRRELWDLLYQLNGKGMTLVVATPYMDEAQKCTHVGLMYAGRVLKYESPGTLIREMEEDILEVETDDSSARTALEDLPGLKTIYPYGGKLHLVLERGKGLPSAVGPEIRKRGIDVQALNKIPPSLEDVFLSLMKRTRGGAPDE